MPDFEVLAQHKWMIATNVPVDVRTARRAERLGNFTILDAVGPVDCLEVYCGNCRRDLADAEHEPCQVGVHLRGGPIGERKSRRRQRGGLLDGMPEDAAIGA